MSKGNKKKKHHPQVPRRLQHPQILQHPQNPQHLHHMFHPNQLHAIQEEQQEVDVMSSHPIITIDLTTDITQSQISQSTSDQDQTHQCIIRIEPPCEGLDCFEEIEDERYDKNTIHSQSQSWLSGWVKWIW